MFVYTLVLPDGTPNLELSLVDARNAASCLLPDDAAPQWLSEDHPGDPEHRSAPAKAMEYAYPQGGTLTVWRQSVETEELERALHAEEQRLRLAWPKRPEVGSVEATAALVPPRPTPEASPSPEKVAAEEGAVLAKYVTEGGEEPLQRILLDHGVGVMFYNLPNARPSVRAYLESASGIHRLSELAGDLIPTLQQARVDRGLRPHQVPQLLAVRMIGWLVVTGELVRVTWDANGQLLQAQQVVDDEIDSFDLDVKLPEPVYTDAAGQLGHQPPSGLRGAGSGLAVARHVAKLFPGLAGADQEEEQEPSPEDTCVQDEEAWLFNQDSPAEPAF
ncbi:hypothetical protein [Kitasatospora viridis]|uniref:Uncharacterized protein n=1 Tax=Kitasatospora viridis TaxID=281105 RepID=A0A561S9Z6_9ACTN|nr:hypothetical protein [Kitasatospora viridis]TWF71696.1 hypothetical protein FHX73_1867 [Kitasatospora viridis]